MKTPTFRLAAGSLGLLSLVFGLVSCGGGSGGASTGSSGIVDSFGRAVDSGDGSGVGVGDAGADGTAGEGSPIVGATITIVDAAGKSVSATTDAQGYYRAKVTGFAPPLVLTATKKTGEKLRSFTLAPLKTNGFVAANVSSVTDKIASDVAVAAGKSGAADLTPQIVAGNTTAVASAKAGVQAVLSAVIAASGIAITGYDPINTPFMADHTGYDKVLDNTRISTTSTGATQLAVAPTFTTPFLTQAAGVWSVFAKDGTPQQAIYRFTSVGSYITGSGHGTFERGTFIVDDAGHFSAGAVFQTTGLQTGVAGLVPGDTQATIKVVGTDLVVADKSGAEVYRAKRVANDQASVVGAWAFDVPDQTLGMQHFVFYPDGTYLMIDPVGDLQNHCGGPGIEYGTYTFVTTSRALTFTGTFIDTNGCAGGHDTTSTKPPAPIIMTFGAGGATMSGGSGAEAFTLRRISQ